MSLRSATSAAACWMAWPTLGSTTLSVVGYVGQLPELRTKAKLHVDSGGSTLQDTESPDNRRGHAVLGLVDLEVLQRALSLSTPVLVGGDLDLAEGIALGSSVGDHPGGGGESAQDVVLLLLQLRPHGRQGAGVDGACWGASYRGGEGSASMCSRAEKRLGTRPGDGAELEHGGVMELVPQLTFRGQETME